MFANRWSLSKRPPSDLHSVLCSPVDKRILHGDCQLLGRNGYFFKHGYFLSRKYKTNDIV